MNAAYLIIAHGSKDEQANREFFRFMEHFRKAYPKRKAEGAFLEIAKPSIPDTIDALAGGGTKEIVVIPLMLFSGRHVKEHIPEILEKAKGRHPDLDFHYATPLGEHPGMLTIVEEKARALKP